MGYKLVAIDCDNTLLDSKGHIPAENKETIRFLKSKGIEFIIATGRNDILVTDYVRELDINAPVIGCNGASIRNLNENKTLDLKTIPKESLKLIFQYCNENKIPFKAFSMEKGFSNDKNSIEEVIKQILAQYTKILSVSMDYEYVENTDYLIEHEKLVKVVLVNDDPKYIKKYQEEIKCTKGIYICRSARNCLDIGAFGASKGNALKSYAKMLGVDLKDTVAFGDSENDLSMIQYAGMGVAMANGEEIVKSAADMVTLSNDECGVANALKKIFSDLF